MLGYREERIEVPGSMTDAYGQARAALVRVGTLKEEDPAERFLRGSARYGLEKVRLKLTVEEGAAGSWVLIRAQGNDVWAYGARRVIGLIKDSLRHER
jgi:hypothetical protein